MQLAVLLHDDVAMVFAARQETLGSLVALHQQPPASCSYINSLLMI